MEIIQENRKLIAPSLANSSSALAREAPGRATKSSSRSDAKSRAATWTIKSSPAWWPRLSFTVY
jgi:hypothetical protein